MSLLPDGAVRSLPKDSGPIDFAYEITSKSVKKRLVPKVNIAYGSASSSGDQVEITN